ncbi:unnamed protein product [Ilex paraguariensis]|uniref:MLO-like protein n=1 Tax=Ilex paraguariensis TaxID=185542 RepID=A0ABC8TYZ5_9AQUA
MAGGGDGKLRELDQTPTWAVAGVCAVIILISIALEKIIHKLGHWFTEKRKKALYEALEKVKAELMILGFISLILVFSQYYIADICIPVKAADTMLPCPKPDKPDSKYNEEENRRKLLWYERRELAGGKSSGCKEGKVPLITVDGLHQLHILIFFLAVFMWYTIRGWKQWEEETSSHDYEFSNGISLLQGCFFRQFFKSVSKSDYLTLRMMDSSHCESQLHVHLAPGSKFNFQQYIKRSLEDDFKTVVGVSPVLWVSFVVFLLLNVDGVESIVWASLIPMILILAVGTKASSYLTKMALEITERHAVFQGNASCARVRQVFLVLVGPS